MYVAIYYYLILPVRHWRGYTEGISCKACLPKAMGTYCMYVKSLYYILNYVCSYILIMNYCYRHTAVSVVATLFFGAVFVVLTTTIKIASWYYALAILIKCHMTLT